MTIVAKNWLTPRRFRSILLIIMLVIAVAIPVTVYWTLQRNETHLIWDVNLRYAQEFLFHTEWAAALMKGTVNSWNNQTLLDTTTELAYADFQINDILPLDFPHSNQLIHISQAIETLRTQNGAQDPQDYIQALNSSTRISLANQVATLGHLVAKAYSNYVNYTSSGTGTGPPFWYNGPSPPDENLLQNAVNVALAFERK